METKKHLNINIQAIILILLFMASMDFFSLHYYCVFAAFAFCMLLTSGRISLDYSFILLIGLAITYAFFVVLSDFSVTSILKPFTYPLCYFIGLNIFSESKSNFKVLQKKINKAIIIVSMGAFTHYMLNLLLNFNSLKRNTIDIWSGSVRSATGQASLANMAIAVFITLLFSNTLIKAKIVSVIGLLIALGYNLTLAGRTLIAMTILLFLVAFIFSQFISSISKKIKTLLIITAAVFLIIYLYNIDFIGIKSIINESNLLRRFEIESVNDSTRSLYKMSYLKLLLVYPFGGGKIHEEVGAYAHDIYLDTYSDVGVVGFIFLILFICYFFRLQI